MLNIGVSLIIFLYVTAVCLFALYFILKISFKEKDFRVMMILSKIL